MKSKSRHLIIEDVYYKTDVRGEWSVNLPAWRSLYKTENESLLCGAFCGGVCGTAERKG